MSTLFCIEHALGDLFETRQELIDEVAFTDEQVTRKSLALDAVNLAILEYVTAEVRKVDNISRFLLELAARRKAIHAEGKRLEALDDGLCRTELRIKEMVLQIMRDTNTKKLEGKIGTLKRQNAGGNVGVDILQPDLLPESFKRTKTVVEPDMGKIREALESGVGVPGCRLRERGEFLRVG